MIMVGHLLHPRFSDEKGRPSSLSRRTIQTEIRDRLGFDGLVVVDDLNMSAISDGFTLERAAVLAVAAGADLLIVGQQLRVEPRASERIISAVSEAVEAGAIDRSLIEASYRRIVVD
jgi:beta-N-acetylhexosaminidase